MRVCAALSCACCLVLATGTAGVRVEQDLFAGGGFDVREDPAPGPEEPTPTPMASHFEDLQGILENPNTGMDLVIKMSVKALVAVRVAQSVFMQDPPDFTQAFNVLGDELWQVLVNLIDQDDRDSEWTVQLKSAWGEAFAELPSLTSDMQIQVEDGNLTALGLLIAEATHAGFNIVKAAAPPIASYVEGIDELIQGVVESYKAFNSGDSAGALEHLYDGITAICDAMLPESVRQSSTYQTVMDKVGTTYEFVLTEVTDWNRRVAASAMCVKRSFTRPSRIPFICAPGFTWDQETKCLPDIAHGAECLASCKKPGRCTSLCGGDRWCCKREDDKGPFACQAADYFDRDFTVGTPEEYYQCVKPVVFSLLDEDAAEAEEKGEVEVSEEEELTEESAFLEEDVSDGDEATSLDSSLVGKCFLGFCGARRRRTPLAFGEHAPWCDTWGDYPEEAEGRCVKKCSDGYDKKDVETCFQECGGKFNAGGQFGLVLGNISLLSHDVCATYKVKIDSANINMLLVLKNTAFAVGKALSTVISGKNLSLSSPSFVSLQETMIELGKQGFALPVCNWTGLGRPDLAEAEAKAKAEAAAAKAAAEAAT